MLGSKNAETCRFKISNNNYYKSRAQAKKHLKQIITEKGRKAYSINVYRCEICGNYHLGSFLPKSLRV